MTIETQVAELTDRTNALLDAVTGQKARLDTAVTSATASQTAAAASKDAAASSATAASGSATTAQTAAATASTQAGTATSKAAEAASSATTASDAAAALVTAMGQFRAIHLGNLAADPTTDGNGNPLVEGAEYYNTTTDKLRVYNGAAWQDYDATAQQATVNAALSASSASSSAGAALVSEQHAAASAAQAHADAQQVAANLALSGDATTITANKEAAAASATAAAASESASKTSETAAKASETAAAASETAAKTSETNAATSAVTAGDAATTATTQAAAASAKATAAATSETNAAASETAAKTSETNAATSAAAAAGSAQAASASAATASTKSASAAESATTATTAAATATTKASEASLSAQSASSSADVATSQANVATTNAANAATSAQSSATQAGIATTQASIATSAATTAQLHATTATSASSSASSSATAAAASAAEAKAVLDGVTVYRGTWDASTGAYPSSPSRGDYYKITTAGTIDGTEYLVGDSIIYSGTGWQRDPSSAAVVRVNGKIGDVVLGKGDIGLGNADNTADADKPVSTAQAAALAGKSDATHTHADLYEPKSAAIQAHVASTENPHGVTAAQVGFTNKSTLDKITEGDGKPKWNGGSWPGSGGTGVAITGDTSIFVSQAKTYTITNYNAFSAYAVSATAGTVSIAGDTISFTAPASAQTVTLTVTKDSAATDFSMVIQAAGVSTPTNSSPTNGATNQNGSVTLSASAFAWLGMSDTHASSDWQVATDAAFTNVVASRTADAANKTSWTVTGLSTSQTYYWRVRYNGTSNGASAWSAATSFTTKANFGGLVGTQGGQGFGVGTYPETLPSGFTAMSGYDDPANANYGNYQYSDGSIMVFVPRFYYRFGNAASPRYATYGANALDIVGIETYATEALANAAGYAMHRAFKDGGADKSGFFIDKYLASKNGTTSCKSIASADPISLTTNASYNPSSAMTGCTGILADAITLARARAAGVFNCASVFQYSALALLALAHAQASSNTTCCAWYDATNNFPKGCNNGSLADTNDATVTYTASYSAKPKTRATTNFAKTTHNGQECGVADINGSMFQVALGITSPGASATDAAQIASGDAYVLKTTVALASLTAGYGGATDAWGTAANLAVNYDAVTGLFPWGSAAGNVYFGSGSNQVFSGATSGVSWQRTACGIQNATTGADATGTSQFGNDRCYQYNGANLFVFCSGRWGYAAGAGAFCRHWGNSRSFDDYGAGFRAAAYGQ